MAFYMAVEGGPEIEIVNFDFRDPIIERRGQEPPKRLERVGILFELDPPANYSTYIKFRQLGEDGSTQYKKVDLKRSGKNGSSKNREIMLSIPSFIVETATVEYIYGTWRRGGSLVLVTEKLIAW